MIDSNKALTVPSPWLKVKNVLYQQQPWKDELEAMKRQGFEQKDYLKGFSVMI
jgi:hypothetical protein